MDRKEDVSPTDEAMAAAQRLIKGTCYRFSEPGWFEQDALLVARALLSPDVMKEALEKAAKQFRFYEREHRNKAAALPGMNADDPAYLATHAKADTNKNFAEMCEAALKVEP